MVSITARYNIINIQLVINLQQLELMGHIIQYLSYIQWSILQYRKTCLMYS